MLFRSGSSDVCSSDLVVALDCYGRDRNGINGLLRNINTALIATRDIGLKRTSVIALLLYRPVMKEAVTLDEVECTFDDEVALMIRHLLKTSDLYARNTAVNSENFHHLLFSFAEDVRVILIMIAELVVESSNGFLANTDEQSFCEKLIACIGDPEMMKRFSKESLKLVQRYSVNKMKMRLYQIYRER